MRIAFASKHTPSRWLRRKRRKFLALNYDNAEFANADRDSTINEQQDDGCTPLHLAVLNASVETVQLLLKYGAKKDLLDKDKKTPLQLAEAQELRSVVDILQSEQPLPAPAIQQSVTASSGSVRAQAAAWSKVTAKPTKLSQVSQSFIANLSDKTVENTTGSQKAPSSRIDLKK